MTKPGLAVAVSTCRRAVRNRPRWAVGGTGGLLACVLCVTALAAPAAAAPVFEAPVDLSAAGRNALAPQVAFDGAGSALAVWERSNGSNSIVQGAFRPAGGAFGAPVDLSAAGQNAFAPQLAFDAAGNALAVWQRSNGSNFIVQ